MPLDVDGARIVASGDNTTVVLDADGLQLLSVPVSTQAAQLAGSDLVVLLPGELRDYDAATGALLHSWPLPDVTSGGVCSVLVCASLRLRLEDAARGLATYIFDGEVHLLRLADGHDVVLAEGTDARFGVSGLFYSYTANGLWPDPLRPLRPAPAPLMRATRSG